jgi:CBS domain-containing protein
MMQIKDVMTREVEVIHPDATLEDAAAKMDALNVETIAKRGLGRPCLSYSLCG